MDFIDIRNIKTLGDLFTFMEHRSIKDITILRDEEDSSALYINPTVKLSSLKVSKGKKPDFIDVLSFNKSFSIHNTSINVEIYDKNLFMYAENGKTLIIKQPARLINYNGEMKYTQDVKFKIIFE